MKSHTSALIAEEVLDAIRDDKRKDSSMSTDIVERAKVWYERLQTTTKRNRNYCTGIAAQDFVGFLCSIGTEMPILDFWDGDIVKDDKGRTGIVKGISISPVIHGGGHAEVLFTDGKIESVRWENLYHSELPDEFLELARTRLKAKGECPFIGGCDADED